MKFGALPNFYILDASVVYFINWILQELLLHWSVYPLKVLFKDVVLHLYSAIKSSELKVPLNYILIFMCFFLFVDRLYLHFGPRIPSGNFKILTNL